MSFYPNFHSYFQIPPLASGRSSDSSGLSDSTFLILQLFSTEECCSLSFSLTLSVHMSSSSILSSCFPDFSGHFLDKDILETTVRFISFSWFSRLSGCNLSVDHFLSWPVDHFSSSICLLSLLWLLWFTLAHSFAFGQGVQLCGNALWSSH